MFVQIVLKVHVTRNSVLSSRNSSSFICPREKCLVAYIGWFAVNYIKLSWAHTARLVYQSILLQQQLYLHLRWVQTGAELSHLSVHRATGDARKK